MEGKSFGWKIRVHDLQQGAVKHDRTTQCEFWPRQRCDK
jgi:hypothetical protein